MFRFFRTIRLFALAAFAAIQLNTAGAPAQDTPDSVVRGFTDAMLAALKASETKDFQGRYELLEPAVEKAFDIDFMSEKSLGTHWAGLSDEQKKQWRGLFLQYMVSTYAARLNKFNGQSFEHTGEEPGGSGTIIIHTHVVDPGNENVSLNYRVKKTDSGGWKIVDIYLKGTVSEIALRRSDYVAVVKGQGFEALVAHLKQKTADLAAGKIS